MQGLRNDQNGYAEKFFRRDGKTYSLDDLEEGYYRLAAEGHAGRWADTFLDPLTEYPSLRPFAPAEPFTPAPGGAGLSAGPGSAGRARTGTAGRTGDRRR